MSINNPPLWLSTAPTVDPVRQACHELESQLRSGRVRSAADFLRERPELEADPEAAIELIFLEWQTRDALGDARPLEAWIADYPAYRERLEKLWHLQQWFAEPAAEPDELLAATGRTDWEPSGPAADQRYELHEEIGRGGMGIVYRARQVSLGRWVALKTLFAGDSTARERDRLQREATALGSLQHPHIVPIYEISLEPGREYLSMEYLAGGSLQAQLSQRQWHVHESANLIRKLARAVATAHQQGIVHRDLKPSNILFTADGIPKIVDFGLAKQYLNSGNVTTHSGALIGTPGYMSPEQIRGDEHAVGPAADIWALGVILYQLLTGRLPFERASVWETLQAIATETCPSPSRWAPRLPRDLATICLKSLQAEPAARYASAAELAEDLTAFLDHRPIAARRPSWWECFTRRAKRSPGLTVGWTVAVLLVCVSLYFIAQQTWLTAQLRADQRRQEINAELLHKRALNAELAYQDSLAKARERMTRWSHLSSQSRNQPGVDEWRRQALEDAVAYYEDMLGVTDDDPQIRWEAALASLRAATLQADLGLWREAEVGLERTHRWLNQLPPTRDVNHQAAVCLVRWGHVLRRCERWWDAEQKYRQAMELISAHLQDNSRDQAALISAANARANLCVVLQHSRRQAEALQLYSEVCRLCLRAAAVAIPASSDLAIQLQNLNTPAAADLPELLRQTAALRTQFRTDGPTGRNLAQQHILTELAIGWEDTAQVLAELQQTSLAEACLREAIALRQWAQAVLPQERWIDHYLARSESQLADLLIHQRRTREALRWAQLAQQRLEQLVTDFPDRLEYRNERITALRILADAERWRGDLAGAAQHACQAVRSAEDVVAQQPGVDHVRAELSHALISLGLVWEQSGERNHAQREFQRAMEVTPKRAEPLRRLAWLLASDPTASNVDWHWATELAELAAEREPQHPEVGSLLALCYARLQRYHSGLTSLHNNWGPAEAASAANSHVAAWLYSELEQTNSAQYWRNQVGPSALVDRAHWRELQRLQPAPLAPPALGDPLWTVLKLSFFAPLPPAPSELPAEALSSRQ